MAPEMNLQTIFQQAMAQLKALNLNADFSAGSKEEKDNFINSIFTQAEGMVQCGDENQEEQVKSVLDGLLSMVNFSNNHLAKANQKVNKNAQAIDKNDKEATKTAQEIQAKVEGFANSIAVNTDNIQNALEIIKDLSENNGFEELKKQIEEQLKIIDEAKANLNDPNKREEALEAIQGAAGVINGLIANIPNIQAQIEEQNTIVEQNLNEITNNMSQSAEAITEGSVKIQELLVKNTNAAGKAGQITADGGVQTGTGTAEVSTGEAMTSAGAFTFGSSAAQGAKLIRDGNGRVSAGQTEISGGTKNLSNAAKSIGSQLSSLEGFSELSSAIGKIGDGAVGLAEQYMSSVQPFIAAVGTWDVDAIAEANAQLQSDVNALSANGNVNVNNQTSENGQEQFLDTKKLRTAFGI